METLFAFLTLFSFIAIIVFAVKAKKEQNQELIKKWTLGAVGSVVVLVISFVAFGTVSEGGADEPASLLEIQESMEYVDADMQESESNLYIGEETTDEISEAYVWAIEELESVTWISSPWSIRQRMINHGGFSEAEADEVLILLENFDWAERVFASWEELLYDSFGHSRNSIISDLEGSNHSPQTIATVMQKIDDLNIDWYEQAVNFINFHGPTSGFMNHENRFRDWMINDIGFTESEAQYAYDSFRAREVDFSEGIPQENITDVESEIVQTLIGTWLWMDSPYYVFEEDRRGTMSGMDILWTTNQGVLTVCTTPELCGNTCLAPQEWYYVVEGNRLTLTSRLLQDMTFTYTRR